MAMGGQYARPLSGRRLVLDRGRRLFDQVDTLRGVTGGPVRPRAALQEHPAAQRLPRSERGQRQVDQPDRAGRLVDQ